MEKSRGHMTEEILRRTLEIISLLYGENFTAVKLGELVTIMVPPHHFAIPKTTNKKKMMELAKQIMTLLMAEVPMRCQDIAVYLSMEERQDLEGKQRLHTSAVKEDLPTDGRRGRRSLERRPLPVTRECPADPAVSSQDSMVEGHMIPGCSRPLLPGHVLEEQDTPQRYEDDLLTDEEPPSVRSHLRSTEDIAMAMTVKEEPRVRRDRRPTEDEGIMAAVKPEEELCRRSVEEAVMMVTIKQEEEEPQARGDRRSGEKMETGSSIISAHGRAVRYPAARPRASPPLCISDDAVQDSSIFGDDLRGSLCLPERPRNPEESSAKHQGAPQREKRFSCPECGKLFDFKSYLEAHRRTHTGERPFSCAECGKSFVHKFSLERHKKYHTPDQLLSCSECGKNFTSRSDLLRHHKSHTGEKPHTCPECGKSFVHKFYLTTHLRSHTGQKPYACPQCGKSYLLKSQLTVHLRFHAGLKPFSCSECGKNFMWRRDLIQHLRVHTRDKPYSCSDCGKKFSTKSYFEKHQRSHTELRGQS